MSPILVFWCLVLDLRLDFLVCSVYLGFLVCSICSRTSDSKSICKWPLTLVNGDI
jgi:hypothetical protein